MKTFITTIALALAIAFAGAAFYAHAGTPQNKADCEAAGGTWDGASNSCK
jgi:hypothetical protein